MSAKSLIVYFAVIGAFLCYNLACAQISETTHGDCAGVVLGERVVVKGAGDVTSEKITFFSPTSQKISGFRHIDQNPPKNKVAITFTALNQASISITITPKVDGPIDSEFTFYAERKNNTFLVQE